MSACINSQAKRFQTKQKEPEQMQKLDIEAMESIVITHYVSPQLFCYITLHQLESCGAYVNQVETHLLAHCHAQNQRENYESNEHVIVRYQPLNMHKLLRGLVTVCQHDEYLVWAMDYGFTINCRAKDLWLLPAFLSEKYIEIEWGGVACVAPRTGTEWSKMALRLLDKRMEEAQRLMFKVEYRNDERHNFGQLWLQMPHPAESLLNAASYLVEKQCARLEKKELSRIQAHSCRAENDMDLAELNDPDIRPNTRALTILELMELQRPKMLLTLPKLEPQTNSQTYSEEKQKYVDSILKNGYHRLGTKTRNLTCPSKQSAKLDTLLQARTVPEIPNSAKRLSKVNSCNDTVVETALKFSSGNSSSSNCSSDSFDAPDQQSKLVRLNRRNILEYYRQEMVEPQVNQQHIKVTQLKENRSSLHQIQEIPKVEQLVNGRDFAHPGKHESISLVSAQEFTSKFGQESVKPKVVSLSKEKLECLHNEMGGLSLNGNPAQSVSLQAAESQNRSVKVDEPLYLDKLDRIYNEYRLPAKSNNMPEKSPPFELRPIENLVLAQDEPLYQDKLDRIYNEYRLPAKSNNMPEKSPPFELRPIDNLVLAHSNVPVRPMSSLSDSLLCTDVLMAMGEMDLQTVLPTQRYSWPHLMKGNTLVLVDRTGSGRSWSYLPPLCSLVMRRMRSTPIGVNKEPSLGPLAVLLADSVANAQALFNHCTNLMGSYKTNMLKVVNTHAHCVKEVHIRLLYSCGILVTTPTHLKQLLQQDMQLIDPRRLKYFVIDDYDRMRASVPQLLNELLQIVQNMAITQLQLVLIAQQWHARVFLELVKRFGDNPLLLFGDFLEAAVYGSLKLNVAVLRSSKKTQQLLDYLGVQNPLKRRTIIYCKHDEELTALQQALTEAGYECIGPTEVANQQIHQLLLLTDAVQQTQLPVGNFELMVHYSLPESWSKFSYRFHAVSDNISNCLVPQNFKQNVVSCVMLDESNSYELPRLVQFLDAHDIELGEHILQMVASCRQLTDQSRQFCPQMLSSGECGQLYCSKRHYPVSVDFQRQLCALWQPKTAVRCNIIKIYDPVHFAVMAVSYKPSHSESWQEALNLSTLRKLSTALYMHMSIEQNRRPKQLLKIADVCVLHRGIKYQRVRVVDLSDKRLVIVQLMDEGTELLKVKPAELLECDARFTAEPPLAMDVRLCGLVPAVGEGDWRLESTNWVKEMLSDLSDNQHLQLIVEFTMFNVVYVKEIAVLQDCPAMRICVKSTQLHDELINRGYARREKQVMENLRKLHEEVISEQQKLKEEEVASPKFEEKQVQHVKLPLTEAEENESDEKIIERLTRENHPQQSSNSTFNGGKLSQLFGAVQRYLLNKEAQAPEKAIEQHKNPNAAAKEAKEPIGKTVQEEKETAAMVDSAALFMDALLQDLRSADPAVKEAAQHLMQDILGADSITTGEANPSKKTLNNNRTSNLPKSKPQLTPDKMTSALCCAAIAGNAARPKVRWHQTLLQIELIFEQQVPQYELLHQGNVLVYQVTESIPPQRCILNLLGAVKILSEQQHGYQLHVKLAKDGLNMYWPSLLDSLYLQQHCHWLVYDTERGNTPQHNIGRILWMRYHQNQYVQKERETDGNWSADEQNDFSDVEPAGTDSCDDL
ncbi:putative ATP-dependent RNA helicase SoYb [Drosophila montana]|uniref:putative ATP-dependent RNA helicase SoYb n=1 Tax=Drosophila montana TaxID=40370 RepID=UPI00313EA60B